MNEFLQKPYFAPECEVVAIAQEAAIAGGLSQPDQISKAHEVDYGEF